MAPTNPHPFQKQFWFAALVLAPLLISASQFFWVNGVLTDTAGLLQILAFAFWIPAFHGMFWLVKDKLPVYAILGFAVAAYACIGGSNFAMDGIFGAALGVTDPDGMHAMQQRLGPSKAVALFIPGALFPLSLIVLGVALWRTKRVEAWVALLLIVAGIGFPLSRIPREPLLAHADNLLLLVSHAMIGYRILRFPELTRTESPRTPPHVVSAR